jgi:hypothetical protein
MMLESIGGIPSEMAMEIIMVAMMLTAQIHVEMDDGQNV